MSSKQESVVITGASGFLGSYLCHQAELDGFLVVGLGRRKSTHRFCRAEYLVSNLGEAPWKEILEKWKPKYIFHLAATASVQGSLVDPAGDFANVIPGSAHMVLEVAKFAPSSKIIFFSSAAVYGNPSKLPITESSPPRPISPYGVNKCVVEALLAASYSCYGVACTNLRIFSAYGVGLRKQLFFDVFQKIALAKLAGSTSIQLFGSGKESRDFIHASDVAVAAILIARRAPAYPCSYNVAVGSEVTVAKAVNAFLKSIDYKVTVDYLGCARSGDPLRWRADVSRLSKLGFVPKVALSSGLAEYANWLKNGHI